MQRWQFALQRSLKAGSFLEVSYVGNRGVRQRIGRNLDALPNQYLSTSPVRDQATINLLNAQVPNPFYPLLPGTSLSGTTVARSQLLIPYPQFTGVTMDTSQGYSWYHSMQTRFEKRFSAGFMSKRTRGVHFERGSDCFAVYSGWVWGNEARKMRAW